MKQPPRFDNSFWDEEIGNFQGWEVVVRRLKDGRQVLKEYSEFLKQRAGIEEQVGKSLVKLAKSITVREDIEPIRAIWEVVKSQTETSGLAHLKSAHQLSAELTKMAEIADQSRDKRRLKEEAVRNHQQNVKVLWKRASESRKIYELKCKEEVASNQLYHQEVARCGKNSREAERAHMKYMKSKQMLDVVEASYQSSVAGIEDARKSWEKETEKSLHTFHAMEEERMAHIRDSLWRVANINSLAAVADDLAAEEVRKTLESTDLDEAMVKFITDNATGSARPESIVFQPHPTSTSIGMGRASSSRLEKPFDTQSLIISSTPTPPSIVMDNNNHINFRSNSASLSSLRDLNNFSSYSIPTYTATMPRGPYLQRHFAGILASHDFQNNNNNNEPPPIRPRKPPRLLHYAQGGTMHRNNSNNISSSATVENTEYFSLQEFPESHTSSSEYQSDTNDVNQDSSNFGSQGNSPPRRVVNFGYQKYPAPLPPKGSTINSCAEKKALVIYDYSKKTGSEMSLGKSQVVNVLEAKPGSEWWKVKDDLGQVGFYPAHYLRIL